MDLQQQLPYLIQEGRRWVRSQQARYKNAGSPLSREERSALDPFFSSATLGGVRVCWVDQIENPPFYQNLPETVRSLLIDFQKMEGITFVKTVLLAQPKVALSGTMPLIFHECVHVVQYQALGIDDFVEQYIKGYAENGLKYENIPLETMAFQLEERFKTTSEVLFFVDAEVRLRLRTRDRAR